jgi:hypothetical protein
MINRLELALMLLLLVGSLMVAVLVANPREGASVAMADPIAVMPAETDSAATDDDRLRLPSFDGFDEVGFGLLPALAPRFAQGQP